MRKLMTVAVIGLALTRSAQAQFMYVTNSGAITITGYTGPGGDVIIPSAINGLPVTSIGGGAFTSYDPLTSVTIPDTITNIGEHAFLGCRSLTNVIIPESVTYIDNYAFMGCTSLTNVIIPEGVTYIGAYGFSGTSLTDVIIPNSVTRVGSCAFFACTNLANVTISSSIARMGGGTFYACANLRIVTIPSNVHTISDTDFAACPNLLAMYFQGNAPTFHPDPEGGFFSMVFSNNPSLTVYYPPGTSGWGPTFGGRPTALWSLPYPLILDNSPSFGIQSNQFGFVISWATNASVVIQAAMDLANPLWSVLTTNTLINGSCYFSDPAWTNYPARFYRIRSP